MEAIGWEASLCIGSCAAHFAQANILPGNMGPGLPGDAAVLSAGIEPKT